MTVRDLIDKLQKLPQDAKVIQRINGKVLDTHDVQTNHAVYDLMSVQTDYVIVNEKTDKSELVVEIT